MKNYITLFSLLIVSSFVFAQDTNKTRLTHYMTAEESANKHLIGKNFVETYPPTGEVRNIAEWESMEGVLITYNGYEFGIPYSLIAEMSEDCVVTTIVSDASEEAEVIEYYTSNGVNTDNCNFMYAPVDSYWARDYSPWYISVDNEVSIVNFPYNRPRPNDNDIPIKMAEFLSIPLYGMDVVQTGGNYMTDGMGMSIATDLVWDEEDQTESEINQKMLDYLGIETYHVVADPMDDYIKHIDCWAKYLDVDKILITQVPSSDYRYNDYEAAAAYFAEQNCSYGYPYQVYRVQAATYSDYDTNPYTNSLILNDKVFVPQTGSSYDDDAIAIYEQAMPGYEIIGVTAGVNGWENTDALHCRTHGIADREMLYIKHVALSGDLFPEDDGFLVNAEIFSYGEDNSMATGFPKLFYKVNDEDYEEIIMTETKSNNYQATIPMPSVSSEISYYIEAEDNNAKNETHPQAAEFDPHVFMANYNVSNISENIMSENFNIYPNPSDGNFFIWLDTDKNSEIDITINSLTGKSIYRNNMISDKNLVKVEISVPQGIYNMTIKTEQNKIYRKLIITN